MTEAKRFRESVTKKIQKIDPCIEKSDLFFSQYTTGYDLEYKPKYPENSSGDFIVSMNSLDGTVTIMGNLQAIIPTVRKFKSLSVCT